MIIVDTSAWVEYFIGSKKGMQIESFLKSGEPIGTPLIVLIEFAIKSERENVDSRKQMEFIKTNSIVLDIFENLVPAVAKNYSDMRKKSKKFSLPDAIIMTIAKEKKALVLTCDFDFNGIENTKIVC